VRGARKKTSGEAIIEAALGVFALKTVEESTMSEIADAACIAKGTVYLYFASKRELADAAFLKCAIEFEQTVVEANLARPRVESFASSLLSFFSARAVFLRELAAALRGRSDYEYSERMRRALIPTVCALYRRDPRYPIASLEPVAEIIVGCILEICSYRILEGRIATDAEALAMLEDFLKRFFDCEA
jgi:AcrR family transcriptional regulator